ncbi:hypothetical protein T11_7598 [Trichinella zimbabwensis]|uniref:Uncharacterized protein n=1 Tax=Trichinella zimbabwensis TaxID=268475 RepID=A0A0V1GP95_9BILA|nr:hypothetical protein T11_7598 [Trichinella zimbabwensis]
MLVGVNPPRPRQNSGCGDFVWRKRQGAEKCVQSCLGERRHVPDEILVVVILWGGSGTWQKKAPMLIAQKPPWDQNKWKTMETARGRKEASKIVQVKADPLPEKWKQSRCGENGIGAGKL